MKDLDTSLNHSLTGSAVGTWESGLTDLLDTDNASDLIRKFDESKIAKDGPFIRYWSNGNKRYEWSYKDGKRADGLSYGYYVDGKIKQTIEWKDGEWNGYHTDYWENGNKRLQFQISGSRRRQNGTHMCWHENGTLSQKGFFVDDKKEGLYVWYNEDGTIQSEEIWKSGELISKT
jgi:antitoxin component YwqK of YwqJK toxin-antitoxin module